MKLKINVTFNCYIVIYCHQQIEPARVIDMSFSRPKRKQSNETIPTISKPTKQIKTLSQNNKDNFFAKLKKTLLNSGV